MTTAVDQSVNASNVLMDIRDDLKGMDLRVLPRDARQPVKDAREAVKAALKAVKSA